MKAENQDGALSPVSMRELEHLTLRRALVSGIPKRYAENAVDVSADSVLSMVVPSGKLREIDAATFASEMVPEQMDERFIGKFAILTGNPGVGKTALASALAMESIRRFKITFTPTADASTPATSSKALRSAMFISLSDLVGKIVQRDKKAVFRIRKADFVVVDNFEIWFEINIPDWAKVYVSNLLRARYENGWSTLIVSRSWPQKPDDEMLDGAWFRECVIFNLRGRRR